MTHDPARTIFALLSLACVMAACKHEPKPREPYQHAVIAITGDTLTVGGESIAARDVDPEKPSLAKDLLRVLRDNRELWKQAHPGDRFDGSAQITLPANLTCQRAMNLWVTASRAGYPRVTLHQAGDSVEFDVYLPGPPPWDAKPPEKPPVRLRIRSDGRVGARDTCEATPELFETNRIATRVWSHEGEPKDLILVACDPGASARDLLEVLTNLRTHGPFRVSSDVCPMGDTIHFDVAESRAYGLVVPVGFGGVQTP